MKSVSFLAVMITAAVLLGASGTQANAIKFNLYVGPYADPYVAGPRHRQCEWVTIPGECYKERVCTRRNKWGKCKRLQWKRVCHRSQQVKRCY